MTAPAAQRLARCLALDAVAAEVMTALADAGIEAILLKGPVTVHWLYADDPGCRFYSDVDVLVAPDRFDAGLRVLAALGFRDRFAGLRASEAERLYERACVRVGGDLVELHRSFAQVGDQNAFWAFVRGHTTQFAVGGRAIDGPDEVAAALLYALHAAQHGRARSGAAKPTLDLRRALTRFDDDVWQAAWRAAQLVDAAAAFTVGLRLDPGGAHLADRIGARATVGPGVWLQAWSTGHRADVTLAGLASPSSAAQRLSYVRDTLFPSPGVLTAPRPWARRNRTLLGVAYLRRWARIAILLPGATGRWSAARRQAARGDRRADDAACRPRSLVRAGARFARHPDADRLAAAGWALRSWRRARGALAGGAPPQVVLPELPRRFAGRAERIARTASTVRRTLDLCSASCLEAAVVRQRWLAAAGRPCDVVVGVAAPASGFAAHAWLEGDHVPPRFAELTRWPVPTTVPPR